LKKPPETTPAVFCAQTWHVERLAKLP
jgi:hypothetical protein